MRTLRVSAIRLLLSLCVVLLCRPLLRAQEVPAPETRTGCLTIGAKSGTYILVEDMTGREVQIVGAALAPIRADQKVTVTGTLTKKDNADVFEATKAEALNQQCQIGFSGQALKTSIGKAKIGVRGGISLDPELIVFGVQAEFGPLFRNVWVRPTSEFAFGEVTKVFSINPEFAYYLPFIGYGRGETRWNAYVGAGPAFTIAQRDFEGFPGEPQDISDWDIEVGANVFFGVANSNGLFIEVKGAAYSTPDVRIYLGYTFK